MSGIDVVGEFGDRWNLASHDPAYVTGNQNAAAVKALLRDIENGPGPIRQQHRHSCNLFHAPGCRHEITIRTNI
jgi:hypothetical protein